METSGLGTGHARDLIRVAAWSPRPEIALGRGLRSHGHPTSDQAGPPQGGGARRERGGDAEDEVEGHGRPTRSEERRYIDRGNMARSC